MRGIGDWMSMAMKSNGSHKCNYKNDGFVEMNGRTGDLYICVICGKEVRSFNWRAFEDEVSATSYLKQNNWGENYYDDPL